MTARALILRSLEPLLHAVLTAVSMQASGLVPIVEPEVLLDGDHDIDRTLEVAQEIWAQTFKFMADQNVRPAPVAMLPFPACNSMLEAQHHCAQFGKWRPACRALQLILMHGNHGMAAWSDALVSLASSTTSWADLAVA